VDCAYIQRFARYNTWANRRLYDACGSLGRADYDAARPSFFGSINRTLNHLLAGDRVWMSRFEDTALDVTALDQVLHEEFAALRRAREAEDARILAYARRLDAADLEGELVYRNMAGEPRRTPLRWALAHFFNHQTHHRGQAHCLLSGTPVAPPPIDLLYFLPEDRG
jgi:uncharacterized damage-inducible protein DinB